MKDITERLRRGFGGLVPPVCDEASNIIDDLRVSLGKWVAVTPTNPGFYWCRDPQIKLPFVIEINNGDFPHAGHEWCQIFPPND